MTLLTPGQFQADARVLSKTDKKNETTSPGEQLATELKIEPR